MAEPTQNYCPKTADLKMFQDSANDKTIASAVKGTHASSTLYSNFDDLRNNCVSALVHNTYGTKGVTPTQTEHFRGYPKPTITLNFEKVTVGTYPSMTYQKLLCKPVLNNKLGFDITVTISVIENDPTDGIDSHDETFTFAAGGTAITSSSLTADGSGKYRLDTTYPQPTNVENLAMQVDNYTAGTDAYFTESDPYTTTLTYTGATTVYSGSFNNYTGTVCGGAVGSAITLYTTTAPTTGGTTDPRWSNPAKFYTDAALTTVAPNASYYLTSTGGVFYDVYQITDGSGTINRVQTDCT